MITPQLHKSQLESKNWFLITSGAEKDEFTRLLKKLWVDNKDEVTKSIILIAPNEPFSNNKFSGCRSPCIILFEWQNPIPLNICFINSEDDDSETFCC